MAILLNPKVKTDVINLEPGSYKMDPQHTSVLFKLNHMGMSTFVGRFNNADASLEFDPAHMENARLSAVINMASVGVNSTDLEVTLRGSSWLDVDRYPQAVFKTTSVELLSDTHAKFMGDLSLHGVTSPIVLDVTFNGGGNNILTGRYTMGFSATAQF